MRRRRQRTRHVVDNSYDVYVDRQTSKDVRRIVSPLDDVGGFRPAAGVGRHVRDAHGSVRGGSGRHRRQSRPLRRPREVRRPPRRASQGAQADVREGGAAGPQEGVRIRQALSDDGTVRGRFLPAGRREDRQLHDQPEGGRGKATAPAQGGRRRHREEADTVAAEVRRPLHRERRNAYRGRAGLGRRQADDGQRVPTAPRLRPHRGDPVEWPAIMGRPADDHRRVPPSSPVRGHRVVHATCHKTSTTYGPARLVLRIRVIATR